MSSRWSRLRGATGRKKAPLEEVLHQNYPSAAFSSKAEVPKKKKKRSKGIFGSRRKPEAGGENCDPSTATKAVEDAVTKVLSGVGTPALMMAPVAEPTKFFEGPKPEPSAPSAEVTEATNAVLPGHEVVDDAVTPERINNNESKGAPSEYSSEAVNFLPQPKETLEPAADLSLSPEPMASPEPPPTQPAAEPVSSPVASSMASSVDQPWSPEASWRVEVSDDLAAVLAEALRADYEPGCCDVAVNQSLEDSFASVGDCYGAALFHHDVATNEAQDACDRESLAAIWRRLRQGVRDRHRAEISAAPQAAPPAAPEAVPQVWDSPAPRLTVKFSFFPSPAPTEPTPKRSLSALSRLSVFASCR